MYNHWSNLFSHWTQFASDCHVVSLGWDLQIFWHVEFSHHTLSDWKSFGFVQKVQLHILHKWTCIHLPLLDGISIGMLWMYWWWLKEKYRNVCRKYSGDAVLSFILLRATIWSRTAGWFSPIFWKGKGFTLNPNLCFVVSTSYDGIEEMIVEEMVMSSYFKHNQSLMPKLEKVGTAC